MSGERMTDLELADAVLDALEKDFAGNYSGDLLWDNDGEPSPEARVRLEALFADLRARGAL